MKKARKLIAVLMSVIMVFGTFSVSASAAYSAYLGDAIKTQYNSIDRAELLTAQKASLLLDDLDTMLVKEEIIIDLPLIGTINLTSTDNALNSIYSLTGNWLYGRLTVGDLVVLETYRDDIADIRRTTEGKTDMDVISSLVTYLSNCAPSLLGMFGDDFSWGIVKGFLPPEFRVIIDDLPKFLYEMIWEALHPVNTEAMPANTSLDSLVQFMCDNQLGMEEGSTRALIMGFAGVMPGFDVNIETDSAYRIIEEAIYEALNAFIIPVLNGSLKQTIQSAVESNQNDGGELHTIINVDYVIDRYNFSDSKGFVEQLNDVFKDVVDTMLKPNVFTWNATGTGDPLAVLEDNLSRLLKLIIQKGGETEDVSGYDLKQLGDYIARVAVEQFVKHLDFEKGDSMEKIAYEGVRELVIRLVPEVNYADLPANTTSEQYRDAIIEMAADLGCYYLNANIGLNCSLSTSAEEFISAFVTWCQPYINGLFDPTDYNDAKANGTGWDEIDAIIWQFIPKNWMNYEEMFETTDGAANGTADNLTLKSLINYFIDAVFDMDIGKLYTFFAHVEDGPLAQPARTVIINFVSNILNTAFYTTDSNGNKQNIVPALANFDAVINPVTNATSIISGLLKALATRTELQTTTVNLVTMLMGLADPQSLGDVDIDIDGRIDCADGSINTSMRISNRSEGINSAWRKADGTLEQDKMYEIELISLENNAGLTASVTSGQKIAANGYFDVAVTGSVDVTKVARFDLSYYILDEKGVRINDGTPIVESVYSLLIKEARTFADESASSSAHNVTFDAFPTYLFTTNVYDAALFSILATNESGWGTTGANIKRAIITNEADLPAGIAPNAPEDGSIVVIEDSSLTTDSYGTVNPYVSNIDPDLAQPYGVYEVTIQFEVTDEDGTDAETSAARDHKIVVYDDYNLDGVLDGISRANRQRIDFADDAGTEWTAYQNAVAVGYALLYGNADLDKMFVDAAHTDCTENAYYDAVQVINTALAALDAKAKPTNAALLAALNAEIAEHGAVDSDNYVLFTYDRFKDAYNRANDLANSQVAPTGQEETFVAPSISVFDLVYATKQLDLWGSRLVKKTAVKTHLDNTLTKAEALSANNYGPISWSALTTAITDANTVYDDTDALQTEVNDARISVMRALRGLTYNYLVAASGKTTVVDSDNHIVYGLTKDLTTTTILDWVTAKNGYTATVSASSGTTMGTGSTIKVTKSGESYVLATYTVIIYCDLNGDGTINDDDIEIIGKHLDGISLLAEGSAAFIAADLNRDNLITEADYDLFSETVNQINPAS